MTIFAHAFRSSLRSLTLPWLGALLLCYLCLQLIPQQAGTGVDRTAGHWLHLAGILLVATAIAAALDSWPLFSRSRPGFEWVLRIENRPLHGCVAAAFGNLTALGLALGAMGIAFSALLTSMGFDQGEVHDHIGVRAVQDRPYLDDRQQILEFAVNDAVAVHRVRLRPSAIYTGPDVRPAFLQILADGRPVGSKNPREWLPNTGDPIDLPIEPPRSVRVLTVTRKAGPGIALRLREGRVELVARDSRSAILNCVVAMLTYLAPALLALAVMVVGHAHLSLPVNFAAGLVVCLLSTLLELAPNTAAIGAFARGRWVAGEGIWEAMGWVGVAAATSVLFRYGLGSVLIRGDPPT